MSTKNLTLDFRKSFDGFFAKINIPEDVIVKGGKTTLPDIILIVDRSGSMGQHVARLVNTILPNMLMKLGYSAKDVVTLITFDSSGEYIKTSIEGLPKCNVSARGSTFFSKGLEKLSEHVRQMNENDVRILTISDGEMNDCSTAKLLATQLSEVIKRNRRVNSQAVRYITSSYGQPDTSGLSSVMQFNNVVKCNLLDLDATTYDFDKYGTILSELFVSDGLGYNITLKTGEEIIANDPWNKLQNEVRLQSGNNVIWFREMPKSIHIDGINANVVSKVADNVDSNSLEEILTDRFDYYLNKIRVLKVVASQNSKEEIQQILAYFEKFQQYLDNMNMTTDESYTPDLNFRFKNLKKAIISRRKSFYFKLSELANDDLVSKLNASQQADYLRGVDVSSNAKGLARRAMKTGFDLEDIVKQEVTNMHAHLSEIKDIDDSNHKTSFYSTETTLGGIKTVCQLVDDGILAETNSSDIMQLINIVGVACKALIGDYPDAMTYRVHEMYYGCNISVSDITVAQTAGRGQKLSPAGIPTGEITNCIPVFDDDRIHQFMRKYAPTILNLVAGIGMRRVMAEVPSTHLYTVCAGLLKCIDDIGHNRSELIAKTTKELAHNYNIVVGKFFDHVIPAMKSSGNNMSYYIHNNGMTNMLNIIYRFVNEDNLKDISLILRAIYCYETYQFTKKVLNKQGDNKMEYISETLPKLLCLDYEKYGTKVGDLFEPTPEQNHNLTYSINDEMYEDLTNVFKYADVLAMVVPVFECLKHDDYIKRLQDLPKLSPELICSQLGIDYDLKTFKFYSLIESLLYHSKQLRVDEENSKMKIPDIGYKQEAEKMINGVIKNEYNRYYTIAKRQKTGEELKQLIVKMVDHLMTCDYEEYCNVLASGFTYKNREFKIINFATQGVNDIKEALLDVNRIVEDRFKKIWVYMMGKGTNGNIVWNNGHAIRITVIEPFEKVFSHFHKEELWNKLLPIYKKNSMHIYRGGKGYANRHGHSNDLPSYWAYGYKTLSEMYYKCTKQEWQSYVQQHTKCCGLDSGKFNPKYRSKFGPKSENAETS